MANIDAEIVLNPQPTPSPIPGTQLFKMRALDSQAPPTAGEEAYVTWVSQFSTLAEAPYAPFGGTLVDLTVLESWFV